MTRIRRKAGREPAVGCARFGDKATKQVVVRFDIETFNQIRDRAVDGRTSFAEQVRQLVEWGLEAR